VCIELAGTQCREQKLAEDADDDFFSHVLHNENHMFYIRCYPNETTMVMNCDADAMNVGYSYVQRCQTQFYIQTVKKNIGHQPTFYCLIAICQFIINGKGICYIV